MNLKESISKDILHVSVKWKKDSCVLRRLSRELQAFFVSLQRGLVGQYLGRGCVCGIAEGEVQVVHCGCCRRLWGVGKACLCVCVLWWGVRAV